MSGNSKGRKFLGSGGVALAVALVWAVAPRQAQATIIPSLCDAAAGNLAQNCGFENGDFSHWARSGSTSFTGIADGNSNSDFVHTGSKGMYEETPPTLGSDGSISQTLSTVAGTTYSISVWYDPVGTAFPAIGQYTDFEIEWNGTVLVDDLNDLEGWENSTSPQWKDLTALALGTGSDTLTIRFRSDHADSGIDDISVVGATAVPEPGSLLLLAGGLAAFGLLRCRRNAYRNTGARWSSNWLASIRHEISGALSGDLRDYLRVRRVRGSKSGCQRDGERRLRVDSSRSTAGERTAGVRCVGDLG